MMFGAVPTLAPAIASGKVRAIAVTTAARAETLPTVPTLIESDGPRPPRLTRKLSVHKPPWPPRWPCPPCATACWPRA